MGSMGTVTRLVCTPEGPCPLGAELKLAMEFTATAPVPGAHWTVTYTVDMTGKRHVVNVGVNRGRARTLSKYSGEKSLCALKPFLRRRDEPSRLARGQEQYGLSFIKHQPRRCETQMAQQCWASCGNTS